MECVKQAGWNDISVGYRDALATGTDGVMAAVITKAIDDYDALTGTESLQLIAFSGRIFRVWEEAYILHEQGRLDDRAWGPMDRQFNGYMGIEPFGRVWEIRKQYFDEEFARYVESLEREDYKLK